MGKRMFEYADDAKFWEVWAEGDKIFTRHGKIGAAGQTKIKAGGADELAKMVKDKIREGYLQTGGDVDTGPALDKKELKKLIGTLKSRSDEGVLVLADWLQQQNHPWGELIVLQHGAATGKKALAKQAEKYLKENAPTILGELANDKFSSFDWEHGLIKRAVIGSDADAKAMIKAVKSLGGNPVAALADTIVVAPYVATFSTWRDWDSSEEHVVDPWTDLEGIAKAIPANITRIGLGGWPAPAAAGYVVMPSFAKVSSALGDRVTALEITGWIGDKPTKLSLGKCTELAVRFARATSAALTALASSKLPKLERLMIWLGGTSNVTVDDVYPPDEWDEDDEDASRYPETFSAHDLERMSDYGIEVAVTPDDVTNLLAAKFSPSLVHLDIGSPKWTPELLAAVAGGALIKTLKSLTIRGGTLDGKDIKSLTKKAFSHLESFQLTSHVEVAAAKKLQATFPDLTVFTGGDREDFHFRFCATVE